MSTIYEGPTSDTYQGDAVAGAVALGVIVAVSMGLGYFFGKRTTKS